MTSSHIYVLFYKILIGVLRYNDIMDKKCDESADTSTIGRNFFSVFAGFHLPMKQVTLLPSSYIKPLKK